MIPNPNHDGDLVNFLRQHRPPIPPASADAEDRLLARIAAMPVVPARHPDRRRLWTVSGAIAAGLVASLIGYHTLMPRPYPSEAELVSLESFIETNWYETVDTVDNEYSDIPLDDPSRN
jgi:hypothetical protein